MKKKLENCHFIFTSREELEDFWNNYIIKSGFDAIVGNTFGVQRKSDKKSLKKLLVNWLMDCK